MIIDFSDFSAAYDLLMLLLHVNVELEFDGISINSMDATGERDFVGNSFSNSPENHQPLDRHPGNPVVFLLPV